jgi:CubicO group peptidase (beta-lactamase class C family)
MRLPWGAAVGAVFAGLALAALAPTLSLMLTTGSGYVAKTLCDLRFLQGLRHDPFERELRGAALLLFSPRVDETARVVTVTTFGGTFSRSAVYREGLGCTLTDPATGKLLAEATGVDLRPRDTSSLPWPSGDAQDEAKVRAARAHFDAAKIDAAVAAAFAPETHLPVEERLHTYAVIVLRDGEIVAERYAAEHGVTRDTLLPGWSMGKSLGNTLIGLRVAEGKMRLSDKLNAPGWGAVRGDPRVNITLDHALRMSTGLEFEENYSQTVPRDPSIMLFGQASTARYAATKRLEHPIDSHWSYASGTSNLLSRALRDSFGEGADAYREYLAFARRRLFDAIGARSFVLETDAAGDFVLSSFDFATARDWARFGLLYLRDGVWEGRRLLPEGWVAYTRTPTPHSSGRYGAHWWLAGDRQPDWPDIPSDAFWAAGHHHQHVAVLPSQRLVVVRLGCTLKRYQFKLGRLLADVVAALKS